MEESLVDKKVEAELMKQLQGRKEGISNSELTELTPHLNAKSRSELINKILSTGDVEMLQICGSKDFYLKYKKTALPSDAPPEEHSVYSIVEESDKNGIGIKDIRDQSGLSETQLRRVLKSLEQKRLIKSIKAVGTTKKCYILYNIDAGDSLTGGTFYSDQQLDSQFVQTLIQVCVAMLQNVRQTAEDNNPTDKRRQVEDAFVASDVVAKYIHDKAISKVELSVGDVESILDVAVLDGKLEKRIGSQYRAKPQKPFLSPLITTPCFQCPMASECRPGHSISPENCEYIQATFDI
ncbi:unnamed protein product [Bursaphelenchus okinawaensis]|uniref:DNA-directed RNA polymerase III subunit RPC6 n=1 Tax=Bursaphelenchus okinawaensis TaxID=465554 RepID=A0A811JVI6_9BILA|nr:unnamed protein product [Bursaphelenchus okinawaensis]CAG9084341.1 unnamed protein product [Bursaphelenchus okinawaensis]